MFINVPNKIYRNDIKYMGKLQKDSGLTYILTDLKGNDLELKSTGYFSYIYNVCNTYLFVIGNCKNKIDIDIKDINFISKILEFEYFRNCKPSKFINLNIKNSMFSILSKNVYQTFNERCFTDDLRHLNYEVIQNIIDNTKIHLQGCKPLEKYCYYLQDNNNGYGLSDNAVSINTLNDNNLCIYKDTSINGFIIKYNNDLF